MESKKKIFYLGASLEDLLKGTASTEWEYVLQQQGSVLLAKELGKCKKAPQASNGIIFKRESTENKNISYVWISISFCHAVSSAFIAGDNKG